MTESDVRDGTVSCEVDGRGVATVLIDRPSKLNAITFEMVGELAAILARLRDSPARVVVIRTAGNRAFSVGADIGQFSTYAAEDMWRHWIAEGHRVFRELSELHQPTVAVIDGIAVGGGLELALACDFRIASDDARFGLPENGIGTIPGWGGTARLTALVGYAHACELVLARRRIDARTAHEWGLVTSSHPTVSLDTAVAEITDDLLGGAALAQQTSKQLLRLAANGADAAVLEALASGFTANAPDFREGVTAFLEKRTPQFSHPTSSPSEA
ncbi:enoyl-CoA hydratase/isomerase family protein [Curtobacterium sp. L1-20]|uniref:enoyl-CoA hydratase/isomerase family protein n=1 Tax=Curtobacterium sp. L1-20 TaxID=3138181 RepID=UPI003B52DF2C